MILSIRLESQSQDSGVRDKHSAQGGRLLVGPRRTRESPQLDHIVLAATLRPALPNCEIVVPLLRAEGQKREPDRAVGNDPPLAFHTVLIWQAHCDGVASVQLALPRYVKTASIMDHAARNFTTMSFAERGTPFYPRFPNVFYPHTTHNAGEKRLPRVGPFSPARVRSFTALNKS